MFLEKKTKRFTGGFYMTEKISELKKMLFSTDTVIIGAGSGLSTSAGFTYSGARFEKYFSDFAKKYGFTDMYSGGLYPYTNLDLCKDKGPLSTCR